MTSMPASRSARATTLIPRSWPSSPGLATTTLIGLLAAAGTDGCGVAAESDPAESDPAESDPGEFDPGKSDTGESDPGESDPGEFETVIICPSTRPWPRVRGRHRPRT